MPSDLSAQPGKRPTDMRWTEEVPDAMLDDALARAVAKGSREADRLAAIATIFALSERARWGHARHALDVLAETPTISISLQREAALVAQMLAPEQGTPLGTASAHRLGVVDALSVLGPFRDTGGGLEARDGPELAGASFDPAGNYSWGNYEVRWREVPLGYSGAKGIPLDLFVHPRAESCSWIATRLELDRPETLTLRVSAAGQVRVVFDAADLGSDDRVHAAALFDRFASRVTAPVGQHLFAVKVCAGSVDDSGRVRLRVTDGAGRWPEGLRATATPTKLDHAIRRTVAQADETPLMRSLASSQGDVDGSLDQAIVRTLGGADDLRSPRSPGLIARLAETLDDPDRLAMLAWISPSGANRSAWLQRARDSHDEAARAFAARRLVEHRIDGKMADWALATLRGAHVDVASDPEATLLAARTYSALGNEALRERAFRLLASRHEPDVSSDILRELASTAEGIDSGAVASARAELASRGVYDDDLVDALADARGIGDVRAAAVRAMDGGLEHADQAIAIAQTISKFGAHADALGMFRSAVRMAPNRAQAWAGLATELNAQFPRAPDEERDIAIGLQRAHDLDPGDSAYRAQLALRRASARPSSDRHDDERYLVTPDVFLARRLEAAPRRTFPPELPAAGNPQAAKPNAPPDVADRELHWMRAIVMHPDRRISELVQYAREIVILPRTEDELYEDIPAEGDLTELLRARVHRADGTTAFAVEEASDGAHSHIRWPELGRGDVIEVAFRSWSAGSVGGRKDPPFFRLDYAGAPSTHALLHNEVIIDSPAIPPDGSLLHVAVVSGQVDRREESREGDRQVIRLISDKPPQVADEPLSPPMSEIVPTIVVSTFRDWTAFRGWYIDAIKGFTEPDAEVIALSKRLTQGRTTREAKVEALFDFVADDIRYVNYTSGETWLPNRPQQLLARREGDCDDKAILLITLLKAVGIDAQEVMVQTRHLGQPSVLHAHGAAVPLFDHGIAFLPGPRGGQYLDATSPQSRVGPLPSMDALATALRVDSSGETVSLPAGSPADHGIEAVWSIKLLPDGSANLTGDEHAMGDDAFWLRTYLTQPGGRAQWLENQLVGTWFPTLEVDRDVSFRGDLPRGGASVEWKAHSTGLARHEGQELVVALSPAQTLASQFAPLVTRTLPVWLPPHNAPRKELRTLRIEAPPGFEFEPLPRGGEVAGGAFGNARLDISRDPTGPRRVVVKRSIAFDQNVISVREYPQWRSWIQKIDGLMHQSIRLAATGGAR